MLSIEGIIANHDKQFKGRIEIDGTTGLIKKIGTITGQADIVCQEGQIIFPGFIDLHVHAREDMGHIWDYKEDFTTAGQAAINGGVVAFADMPNNPVPPIDDESYGAKAELAKKCAADVLLYAGIGPKTHPLKVNVPYKTFMGHSVGDLFFESFDDLDAVLFEYQRRNVSFHCEDPEILEQSKNQPTHSSRRPPEAETSALDFALGMIQKHNLKGKICHCSTAESIKKIIEAKNRGLQITVEVTPHHLYFDETMISGENQKMFQVNPPIRQSKENRLVLIEALKKGDIDYLATDHAPHTIEEKQKGTSGLAHLDTFGPFAAWLMAEHEFTAKDIARVCSYNPGEFINQFSHKKYGQVKEGFAGSLTIINNTRPITVERSWLKTKAGQSPFEGITFPGSVAYTVVKGKIYGHE